MFVESVLQMPAEEIELKQNDLIGNFPNTYTFTKNIGEKLLKKHRGSMPVVIVRPSIIGCAYREPMVGWVDAISAATAIYLTTCLGINKDLLGRVHIISDQIPVDYVAALIISSTADNMNKDKLMVYHSASSSRNPITWSETIRYFWPYITRNPIEKRVSYPSFDMYKNKSLHAAVFYIKRQLPANIFYYASRAIGNQKMKKDAERYVKILEQCKNLNKFFGHFTNNEWIYDTYNGHQLAARLPKEDLETYMLDIGDLSWKEYFPCFGYGMLKFIMKEEIEYVYGDRVSIINSKPDYFSDIAWVFKHGKEQKTRDHKQIQKMILNSESVRLAIREVVQKEMVASSLNEQKLISHQNNLAIDIIDRMTARLSFNKMRTMGYVMHKAFLRMYEKVIVNKSGLNKIKDLYEANKGNVIFVPTHRSYVDFLIISYVLYAHNLKVPHICAGEDFLNIAVIHTFLRNSGAFFMKRSFKDDILYKSIFTEYIQTLLNDNHSLEFFLEGTRARSGKMLKPKFGILNILCEAFFKGKVDNLYFVPITINYSRVLEGETFPLEILGESKVKESLSRIINSTKFINMNFGQIYVEFTDPINFKDFTQEMVVKENLQPKVNRADQKLISNNLGYYMNHRLTNNLVIMPTNICASLLLMHRKGISEDELVKQIDWLVKELKHRNVDMPSYCNDSKICMTKGTYHLNETVGKKKDIFQPRVIPKIDYKNILLLGYYRNNLIHIFLNEAFIACSLFGFGHHDSWKEGVGRQALWEKTEFISKLLQNEFVLPKTFNSVEYFDEVLAMMIQNETLSEKEDGSIIIHPNGENHINYLNSLIWPFIDTYWVTFVFIFSLVPSKFVQEGKMYEKTQWFAESLYEDQIISFYESCSQEIIKNAVSKFFSDGIIIKQKLETITDGEKDPFVYTLSDEYNDEDKMHQFYEKLSFYRKTTLVKMNSITNIRKTLLSDFPFMAKM
jgi:1-acyl-sn-glycerol-3-phosphate acyltransferase